MIQPHNHNILVKAFKMPNTTQSGIIVPDALVADSQKVKIISVGNKVTKVKAGQIGFRVKDWGEPIEDNGELFYLMDEKAILAFE